MDTSVVGQTARERVSEAAMLSNRAGCEWLLYPWSGTVFAFVCSVKSNCWADGSRLNGVAVVRDHHSEVSSLDGCVMYGKPLLLLKMILCLRRHRGDGWR